MHKKNIYSGFGCVYLVRGSPNLLLQQQSIFPNISELKLVWTIVGYDVFRLRKTPKKS